MHDKISISWVNRLRKCARDGKNTIETLQDLVMYGFETERRINKGFGHDLTFEEYVNSFDTEIDFHEMEDRP
jgi:hypothetical protein